MAEGNNNPTVTISTISILKVLFIMLLLWFLFAIKEIILVFLISLIIASAIDPLADWLYKRKIPRGISVLLVYLFFIGLITLIVSLLVPPVTEQFRQIGRADFYETFSNRVGSFRDTLNNMGIGDTLEDNIKNAISGFSSSLFQTTKGVLNGFVSVITVLAISFYLTVEENGMKNLIRNLTPYKHQSYIKDLVNRIQKKMGAWVLGQIILSAIIFGLTYLGLTILGVEFALVLAVIAGVLEIIPYIGPMISVVPAVFFAFIQNPALAVAVLILYIVVQQLENHILVPVVMSKSVGLNPIIVILGILIGGTLAGVIGAIIAVPVISGISIFVSDLLN